MNVEIKEGATAFVNQMVASHAAEFGISILPAGDFAYRTLLEDQIVAILKDPLAAPTVDLTETDRIFCL